MMTAFIDLLRSTHRHFLPLKNSFPISVIRYFCLLLLGLSGIVISSRPFSRRGLRIVFLKCFRSLKPLASCISDLDCSFSAAFNTANTFGGVVDTSSTLLFALGSRRIILLSDVVDLMLLICCKKRFRRKLT